MNRWLSLAAGVVATVSATHAATPSFADFDRRAQAGERLTVVFFGASLTWGANASDQANTSYRAVLGRMLEARYPAAHFRFYDAAIGGTGSQLGVFRVERDVLRRQPDLVFLDFSANDDIYSDAPEKLASYEAIVRRLIRDGQCPVVQVIFPFRWNVDKPELEVMKGRLAHLAIADFYGVPSGDAIALAFNRIQAGETTVAALWPYDGVHPGDAGYALFADAAWEGFERGVKAGAVCRVPEKMLHAATYMQSARVPLDKLAELPAGWTATHPSLTAAWHDALMSRWLDGILVGANRRNVVGEDGKKKQEPQMVAPLTFRFRGEVVLLFGEKTVKSGKYRMTIDGEEVVQKTRQGEIRVFDASSANIGGTTHLTQTVVTGLDANAVHTLVIEPLFAEDQYQELRLGALCLAGGTAENPPGLVANTAVEEKAP